MIDIPLEARYDEACRLLGVKDLELSVYEAQLDDATRQIESLKAEYEKVRAESLEAGKKVVELINRYEST